MGWIDTDVIGIRSLALNILLIDPSRKEFHSHLVGSDLVRPTLYFVAKGLEPVGLFLFGRRLLKGR